MKYVKFKICLTKVFFCGFKENCLKLVWILNIWNILLQNIFLTKFHPNIFPIALFRSRRVDHQKWASEICKKFGNFFLISKNLKILKKSLEKFEKIDELSTRFENWVDESMSRRLDLNIESMSWLEYGKNWKSLEKFERVWKKVSKKKSCRRVDKSTAKNERASESTVQCNREYIFLYL